jgi:hypothetical protein
MRVSLQIDGDAKGAIKAAEDAQRGISDIVERSIRGSREMQDAWNVASGAAATANDNALGGIANLAKQFAAVAEKARGANDTIAKSATAAGEFSTGAAALSRAVGPIGLITAGLGLAGTAATLFYQITNSGSATAQRNLDEQAKLVGDIRTAYSGAAGAAERFVKSQRDITLLQTSQNLIALRKQLNDQLSTAAAGATFETGQVLPSGQIVGSRGREARRQFSELSGEVKQFYADVAAGNVDVEGLSKRIAGIGNSAAETNPKLAQQANEFLNFLGAVRKTASAIELVTAAQAVAAGTATKEQQALVGVAGAAKNAGAEFDRLAKSLERQSAAQEAEAIAVGKSVGESQRLRAEFTLQEAAQQAGIKVAGDYADKIKRLADRYGEAAQRVAELRLKSDTAFDRGQLGRDPTEAVVADKLRSVYGDDFSKELDSSTASAIRLNEQLRIARDTTTDIASGGLKDFKNAVAGGATAFDALKTAAGNALNKISDKLIDMATQNLVSKAFGGSGGGFGGLLSSLFGGSASAPLIYGPGFDAGGFTGDIARGAVAGVVHGQEFVVKADATARHRPLLEAINSDRLPGYANGGYVGSLNAPAAWRATEPNAAFASPAIQVDATTTITIAGNADRDAIAELRLELAERDRNLPNTIIQTVRDAQDRRHLR